MRRQWLVKARGGLTHGQVAQQAGIKRQYYTMIECGARKPSVAVAKRIASALKFDWTIFFDDIGNETSPSESVTSA